MKKTSVYLRPEDEARLGRIAEREGRTRAEVIRQALVEYDRKPAESDGADERPFYFFNSGEGDGRSLADFTEEEMAELMKGFGED